MPQIGQIDPRRHTPRPRCILQNRRHRPPALPHLGTHHMRRIPQHQTQTVQIVNHTPRQRKKRPRSIIRHIAHRLLQSNLPRFIPLGCCFRRQIVKIGQLKLLQMQIIIRMQMIHLHKTHIARIPHLFPSQLIRRIINLHIAHLPHRPRSLPRSTYCIHLLERIAHRLLNKHMLARLKSRHRQFRLRIGMTQNHGIHILRMEQLMRIRRKIRHAKNLCQPPRQPRRNIAHPRHLIKRVQNPQIRHMLHLGNRPATNNSHPDLRHHILLTFM